MEGLRGVAVALVFLQHYCRQFIDGGRLTGPTALFATIFRSYGNNGVELFFVISGFLIYGILIKKQPSFFEFMRRRAQRIYPTFLAALVLACLIDRTRQTPYIPHGALPAALYITQNILFLPGLLPITPLASVNWSLSYEWWFYATITALFASLGLITTPPKLRISIIFAIAALLVFMTAQQIPFVPIRALALLAGMILAEIEYLKWKPLNFPIVMATLLIAFLLSVFGKIPAWINAITIAGSFLVFCHYSLFHESSVSRFLSHTWLRRFGNISYSFYLVHGFVVVTSIQLMLRNHPSNGSNLIFWATLIPIFLLALAVSGSLYLMVEKPLSLRRSVSKKVSSTAKTLK